MSENWRPENWNNPCYQKANEMREAHEMLGVHSLEQNGASFEAGADACLVAFVEWAESIQDDEWLSENPTLGMCLSLDCWSIVGGGARARSLFAYNKLKLTPDEETKT